MIKSKKTKKLTKDELKKRFHAFLASLSDDGNDDSQASESEEEFESLRESEIRTKLSSIILSTELENRFKDLFNVRKSVILQSHCSNNCVDANNKFEDLPKNDEESLQLSEQVPLEEVNLLRKIMSGIQTKRRSRSKGSKKEEVDNVYRSQYLSFLTHCWIISGAGNKVEEIGSVKKFNDKTKTAHVHKMEDIISQILSEFMFLGYNECRICTAGNK